MFNIDQKNEYVRQDGMGINFTNFNHHSETVLQPFTCLYYTFIYILHNITFLFTFVNRNDPSCRILTPP